MRFAVNFEKSFLVNLVISIQNLVTIRWQKSYYKSCVRWQIIEKQLNDFVFFFEWSTLFDRSWQRARERASEITNELQRKKESDGWVYFKKRRWPRSGRANKTNALSNSKQKNKIVWKNCTILSCFSLFFYSVHLPYSNQPHTHQHVFVSFLLVR